jgi:hypothetical protein
MNSGEIPVLRFEGAQGRAETVAAHLRIETAAQFVVINEKMGPVEPKRSVRLDLFQFWETAAHCFRECPLSAALRAPTGNPNHAMDYTRSSTQCPGEVP